MSSGPDGPGPSTPTVLTLRAEGVELGLVSTGAAVSRLLVGGTAGAGTATNVVLGHAQASAYRDIGGYLGVIVGRCANRIDGGRLTVDGSTHQLSRNDGGNTLHGGADGLDRRDWALVRASATEALWSITSAEGDQGFPGTLEITVRYAVSPGVVSIDYTATTTAPTPVNLTNHAYFNLDGEGSGSAEGHVLSVEADSYLPTRPDQIPTGEIRDVTGTAFDLREPVQVAQAVDSEDEQVRIAGGIDHHFVVPGLGPTQGPGRGQPLGEALRRHATLTGVAGRRLEVWSDQPGIQVYTGAHFDGTVLGPSGTAYQRGAGIALETQGFPDAVNHPHFPGVLLHPGQTYRSRTEWRLG